MMPPFLAFYLRLGILIESKELTIKKWITELVAAISFLGNY